MESSTCDGETDPVSGECIGGTVTQGSCRVRKVSSNGQISTAVGTGEKYNPAIHTGICDGGPASAAVLVNPTSVSLGAEGNIYLGDGARIRKVNTSGLITTVVGTGSSGSSGDGGLALYARVSLVSGITFDRSGNFYFSQFYHNGDVVRRVTSNGFISTVAGDGAPGLAGDDGPATRALLAQPERVAVDPAGDIYILDRDNSLIVLGNRTGRQGVKKGVRRADAWTAPPRSPSVSHPASSTMVSTMVSRKEFIRSPSSGRLCRGRCVQVGQNREELGSPGEWWSPIY